MIRAKVLQDNQRLADGVVGDLYSSGSGLFTYEEFVGAQLPKAPLSLMVTVWPGYTVSSLAPT